MLGDEDRTVFAEVPVRVTVKVVDVEGKEFCDVKADDFVSSHGIFKGTGEGFELGTRMNRAMLAPVLFSIAGEAEPKGGTAFGDVPVDA